MSTGTDIPTDELPPVELRNLEFSYSLTDNDGGRFAINSSTGVVTVAGAIDREADGASRNIIVRATSVDGSFTDRIQFLWSDLFR